MSGKAALAVGVGMLAFVAVVLPWLIRGEMAYLDWVSGVFRCHGM